MAATTASPGLAQPGLFSPGDPTSSAIAVNAQSTTTVAAIRSSTASVTD